MSKHYGFTIIELLIVIVVIGILATITIVAYSGIQASAGAAVLKSDLDQTRTQLALDQVEAGTYPDNIDGYKHSDGVTLEYTSDGSGYCITASSAKANTSYKLDSTTNQITEGICEGHTGIAGEDDPEEPLEEVLDGLIGWWKLNGNAIDSIGSNNGTPNDVTATTGQDGLSSSAYLFNGTSARVALPTTLARPTDAFSLSAWVKPTAVSQTYSQIIVGSLEAGGYALFIASSNVSCSSQYAFEVYIGGAYKDACSGSVAAQDAWSHMVGVYNGSDMKLYINGTLVKTLATSGSMTYGVSTVPTCIGGQPNTTTCTTDTLPYGSIDDVRIYNRALSSQEVSDLFVRGAQ